MSPTEEDFESANSFDSSWMVEAAPELTWLVQEGAEGRDGVREIVAHDGDIYAIGDWSYLAHTDQDGNQSFESDVYVARYSGQTGERIWWNTLGSLGHDNGFSLAVAETGEVFVTGTIDGALREHESQGFHDFVVAKFDAKGESLWTRQFGGPEFERSPRLALGGNGEVLLIGESTADFASSEDVHDESLFLASMDADEGSFNWQRQIPLESEQHGPASVLVEEDGGIIVVAWDYGKSWEDGQATTLIKLDAEGTVLWQERVSGGSFSEFPTDAALDSEGALIIVGTSDDSVNSSFTGRGFVQKRSAEDGRLIWRQEFGSTGLVKVTSVSVTPDDNIWLAGGTRFEDENGMYVALLSGGDGEFLSSQWWTEVHESSAWATAVLDSGALVLAGTTSGLLGEERFGGYDTFLMSFRAPE